MKVIAPPVRQHSLGKPNGLRQSRESVRGAIVQRRLPTQEKRIPDVEGRLGFIRSPDRAVQRARRSDFKEVTLSVIAYCNDHQCPDR